MFLLAGLLALASCNKPTPPPPTQQGIALDLPKLKEAFASSGPEIQTQVATVLNGVRYEEFATALATLDKLAQTPGLTEPQKKIVTQVTEQVKQVASKAAAPRPR